ncbi:uncharacterized protein PGTG_12396 [Puccinia graminis f. sp. tritici CRL 75-36-700-3]|uniref:Uncharacterized protein n=1 Tax=Puccinia graminis f. sp. tritici (strain CRL 75-36-700-3 / race SCCL) TaxID=418459 RepID=E3KQ65_PUCGT|nr:uncharacterized protein PGTG_12396 [Puccinia graminis f. sp. tritici CRL 75-36-700-3]EFP86440.2 hypothetical protein PGTG_12396 [Puccinia graminis f. sp. tritici CRL 75-36-700-3]
MTVAEKTAVPATTLATNAPDSMDLDPSALKTPVQRMDPATIASEAMDVDPVASTSSVDIQLLCKLPEKQAMSKEEKIKLLVKEHIHLWKRCLVAKQSGSMEDLKILLHQAQDSQKVLQKLISKQELEEFVKGWNPWTIKKELFPQEKREGKKRSSSSKVKKEVYNNPLRWKKVMRGCNTLEAAYRHMAD